MQPVIFQSLYSDANLTSLKHALFYFGKLRLPMHSFVFTFGDDPPRGMEYITLIPESIYEQIEWLEERGVVEIEDVQDKNSFKFPYEPELLVEQIISEVKARQEFPKFTLSDLREIYNFFGIPPDHPNADILISQIPIHFSALSLQLVAKGRGLPCVDNRILFYIFNLGLKRIFESFINSSGFQKDDLQTLKEQYLAQQILNLHLPLFEFKTFEDVLEARERFKDEIGRFKSFVSEISRQYEAFPWDTDLPDKTRKIITKEVEPELANIRSESRFRIQKVVGSVLSSALLMSLQSVFPQIIRDWLIGFSASSIREAIKKEYERGQKVKIESALSILLRKESDF